MKKEVVIVGGGFAGLNLAESLAKNEKFHVTVVDRNNYNFFPPLLYQVATGFLEVSNISYPFRKMFHKMPSVNFRMGELMHIDQENNKIVLTTGEVNYDYLVLATGTTSNFFGNEHVEKNALPMKTVNDAIELRNYLLLKIEEAVLTNNPEERSKRTTIVVAGGGPTGVEIAGMIAEMRSNIFDKDYPELKKDEIKIYLVDGSKTLLAPMSKKSQDYTYNALVKKGVIVKLEKRVQDYIDDEVIFTDGERIKTKLLIWSAGVTAVKFDGLDENSYGRGNRVMVDEYNKVVNTKNIFALGDTCIMSGDPKFPDGHPQLAQPAIQQGQNLGKNLDSLLKNKSLHPFRYVDKGSMAIIGRSQATADIPRPKMHFTGWLAWAMWLFVHLFSLISYRNRFKTMYNWTLAYFTKDQSLRMIIRPKKSQKIGHIS